MRASLTKARYKCKVRHFSANTVFKETAEERSLLFTKHFDINLVGLKKTTLRMGGGSRI